MLFDKGTVVQFRWNDACKNPIAGWIDDADADDWAEGAEFIVDSVGIVWRHTETSLTFVQSWYQGGSVSSLMTVPTSYIISIEAIGKIPLEKEGDES